MMAQQCMPGSKLTSHLIQADDRAAPLLLAPRFKSKMGGWKSDWLLTRLLVQANEVSCCPIACGGGGLHAWGAQRLGGPCPVSLPVCIILHPHRLLLDLLLFTLHTGYLSQKKAAWGEMSIWSTSRTLPCI